MAVLMCVGCEETIEDDVYAIVDGADWHESCFDNVDGSSTTSYCCGSIYEEGETVCASCGDPL